MEPRSTLRRRRLAKRHRIDRNAPRGSDPVGRRDGEAAESEPGRRGIGPANAIGVRARNARRLGHEAFRPQRGSASPPLAKPCGRGRSRPSSGMAAHARARLPDPGRGIRGSRSGDLAASARAQGGSLEVEERSSLCKPQADDARGRRAQARSSAGPGMERPSGAGHDPRRRVCLERRRLPASQVAKTITGTNWNGHRFFGLRAISESTSNRKQSATSRPKPLLDIGVSPCLPAFAPAMPDPSTPFATKKCDSASSNKSAWRPSSEGGPKARQIGSHKDPRSDPRGVPRQAQAVQDVRR